MKNVESKNVPARIILVVLKIILIIIAAIVALALILTAVYMPDNRKAMNEGVEKAVSTIQQHAEINEKDTGKFHKLRFYGIMNFEVHQYEVEGIGNLSTMTMNAGLMQMSTVILTPLDKDIPLISTDYMYILGNRTSYLECYDLVLNKDDEKYQNFLNELKNIKKDYTDLDTLTPSSAWYDGMRTVGMYMNGKAADDSREEEALVKWLEAAMNYADQQSPLTEEQKQEKLPVVKKYTDGLIEQGGVSTDVFVKAMGKDKTRDFFHHVLFGTGD